MLAFSNDYYGIIFRATQSVELFCAYFVSAKNIGLPQVEIEIDMIDRNYADVEKAQSLMEIFKENICFE